MSDNWIKYNGIEFPVPLGSEVEIQTHSYDDVVKNKTGILVCYESYLCSGHESASVNGFYWKIQNDTNFFNFNCSEIDKYRVIKSSIPESTFDTLAVCKDLIWTVFHGSSTDAKYRGVNYLRRECNLRNSEICDLLGLKSEDIDFILNNKEC